MSSGDGSDTRDSPPRGGRRGFMVSSGVLMAGGLVAGYGGFGVVAARYLYPARPTPTRWQLVARLGQLQRGDAIEYVAPDGAPVTVARLEQTGTVSDFVALSSICPHLGCRVHWEAHNDRFFCPCHGGAFDRTGAPTAGPPAKDGTPLERYPLRAEGELLFIDVPVGNMVRSPDRPAET